jgi:glycosyltransferase involved in cell wall biosynthesis
MNDPQELSEKIQVVIVLPFLNEDETLFAACKSLGFGKKEETPSRTFLILVDNGSTDTSPQIAQTVRESSYEKTVVIDFESERGYVPPRKRGNLLARHLAQTNEWDESNVLVLQADADVFYPENYAQSMRSATQRAGGNILLEGLMTYPTEFLELHKGYFDLCDQTEKSLEHFFATDEDDCIVVDCVAGYRLGDYFSWGEHRREYNTEGDELYSETTRLYMKAKSKGARRVRVDDVLCSHSARKVILDPSLHFATAGFPREQRWSDHWSHNYQGPMALSEFYGNQFHSDVQKSIFTRQQHLIAIFTALPFHVNSTLGKNPLLESEKLSAFLRSELTSRTTGDLRDNPGFFISDVFRLLDRKGNDLLRVLES